MTGLVKARHQGDLPGTFSAIASCIALAWTMAACGGGGGGGDPGKDSASSGTPPLTSGQGVSSQPDTSGNNTTSDNSSSGTGGSGTGGSGSIGTGISGGSSDTSSPVPESSLASVVVDSSPSWTASVNATVATFDSVSDAVSNWTFYPGSEFVGGNGSLTETAGMGGGKAASLNYDLGCNRSSDGLPSSACGRYVAMNLRLASPVSTAGMSQPTLGLWIRNTQGTARPTVRVTDDTNQTLQFKVQLRTLEQPGASEWQYVEVPLANPWLYFSNTSGGVATGVLGGQIKNVSVMNGDLPLSYVPGTMEVDNVKVLNAPSTSFELKTNSALSSTTFPSTYVGRIGVVVHTYTTAALDKAGAAGIKLIRKDLCWACVEVNGSISFNWYNTFMSDLASRGMSVLWILDYGHPDHGGDTPKTNGDRAAYAEFARQAALKYKTAAVKGYEVWNEPNIPAYWPNPDPAAYASLFEATASAIKSADASANVVTGGIGTDDFPFLMNLIATRKLGGATAFGLHPYRKTAPETYASEVQPLRRMLGNGGLNIPTWDTEWGYSSYTDIDATVYGDGHDSRARRRQGVLTLRKVLTNIALNTPVSTLYQLMDTGTSATDREANFGLLTIDGQDKPAIVGLRTLYSAQNGRTLKGFLPDVPPNLHVLRWDGSADQAFVVWTERTTGSYTVTLPAKVATVKLWDGTVITPVVTGSGKQITVTEASGPVFVTVTR